MGALVGTGSRILDCCAAPGNKTMALAEANPRAAIVAVELHPHRAELLRQTNGGMRRCPDNAARECDLGMRPAPRRLGDSRCSRRTQLRFLMDASSTASWPTCPAREPARWRAIRRSSGSCARKISTDLHARQKAILRSALRHLAAGGVIVYSTCSLEAEENAAVVEEVLREHPAAKLLDCRARLDELKAEGELTWPDVESLASGPYLRTLPGTHPCDGFFAAMIAI